jgi:hypothetical protein
LDTPIISKGIGYKDFKFNLVVEANTKDVLDMFIKELEDYSIESPQLIYSLINILSDNYDYTYLSSLFWGLDHRTDISLDIVLKSPVFDYMNLGKATNLEKYGIINIPITTKTKNVLINPYITSTTANKCSLYYIQSATPILSTTQAYMTSVNQIKAGTKVEFDLTSNYPTYADYDINIEPIDSIDGYLVCLFQVEFTSGTILSINATNKTNATNYYNELATTDVLVAEFLALCPYYVDVLEKERISTENICTIQITGRYER